MILQFVQLVQTAYLFEDMAALGISTDVRAQIQSHGLGGIQARHYDRHEYMPEKCAALELWARRFRNLSPLDRGETPKAKSSHFQKRDN